jgi:hypothetical protein
VLATTKVYYIFIEDSYFQVLDGSLIKPITNGFFGIWPSGIDSMAYTANDYYWFFKGNKTILYYKPNANSNGSIVSGYPKNIADVWKGNSNLTYVGSAFHDNARGKMYLTQGNVVYTYEHNGF